jgi:agarase
LLDVFLDKPAAAPGKQALVRMLRERFKTVEKFNEAWGTKLASLDELAGLRKLPPGREIAGTVQRAFMGEVARTYFRISHEAIRAVDPNHLILGSRFAGHAPDAALHAMKGYADVISFNDYSSNVPGSRLAKIHEATGMPILIGEFSFRADHSGLPNTSGPGPRVKSQQERAKGYERYTTQLARIPYVIGFHWFKYADEPPDGRFDGENSNYGIVRNDDEIWAPLADGMRATNARIDALHADSFDSSKKDPRIR